MLLQDLLGYLSFDLELDVLDRYFTPSDLIFTVSSIHLFLAVFKDLSHVVVVREFEGLQTLVGQG